MIRANPERLAPKIGPPVAHGLHQAKELPLIGGELKMAHGERPAKERERSVALMKDSAKPHTRGVAVHDERAVEVKHLEDGTRRERPLRVWL